jgi:hypothetical protein
MLKKPSKCERDTSYGKIHYFLRQFLLFYYQITAGRIARKFWWKNQCFPVDIIPPWFSMLIYHLGG